MAFRLLRYIVRIWEQHRSQHPEEHPLPRIVPVVFYHGTKPWTAPRFLSEALESRTDLGVRPPELEYVLLDLSHIPDAVLREGLELGLMLAIDLFRHIRDPDFIEYFKRFLPLMAELQYQKTGLEYIETILRYVYYVRSGDEWEDVVDILRQSEPIIKETAMTTIAEYLIEKGLIQGLEQGETKGKLSEARSVLIELLEEQFGIVTSSLAERLARVQSYDVLVSLRRRRKSCRTLEEFESLIERALQ
jgi:predicted transposase/invertase (TIGR01784 family)